jgi:hypothetical protein
MQTLYLLSIFRLLVVLVPVLPSSALLRLRLVRVSLSTVKVSHQVSLSAVKVSRKLLHVVVKVPLSLNPRSLLQLDRPPPLGVLTLLLVSSLVISSKLRRLSVKSLKIHFKPLIPMILA